MSEMSKRALREEMEAAAEERMQQQEARDVFRRLSAIDVSALAEEKPCGGGRALSYLPWASAWAIVKSIYPDADYQVYEAPGGCLYWSDLRTAWVKVGVTIAGREYIERLPVMDARNNSIPVEKITSRDASDSIQRCTVKAIARHGLGLSLYTRDGLPEGVVETVVQAPAVQGVTAPPATATPAAPTPEKSTEEATAKASIPAPGWKMTEEHKEAYMEALQEVQEPYNRVMEEPLYKALLREMGVKTFKEIEDERFPLLMEKIEACRALVCGGED